MDGVRFVFLKSDQIFQFCFYSGDFFVRRVCRCPADVDAVAFPSGDQVQVEVEYCLACHHAVVLQDIHVFKAQHFFHGFCQFCCQAEQSACLFGVDFKDICHMVFGQDQGMTFAGRESVQDHFEFVIFVYGCRRDVSCNDFSKNTIAHGVILL